MMKIPSNHSNSTAEMLARWGEETQSHGGKHRPGVSSTALGAATTFHRVPPGNSYPPNKFQKLIGASFLLCCGWFMYLPFYSRVSVSCIYGRALLIQARNRRLAVSVYGCKSSSTKGRAPPPAVALMRPRWDISLLGGGDGGGIAGEDWEHRSSCEEDGRHLYCQVIWESRIRA